MKHQSFIERIILRMRCHVQHFNLEKFFRMRMKVISESGGEESYIVYFFYTGLKEWMLLIMPH